MIDGGVRRSITGHNRNYPLAAIQHRVCFELILTARQGEDAVFRSTRKNSRERVESISYTNHAAPIMIDRRAILPFFKRPNFFSEFLFFFFFFQFEISLLVLPFTVNFSRFLDSYKDSPSLEIK